MAGNVKNDVWGVDMMYQFMTLNVETEIVPFGDEEGRAGFRIIRGRMLRALMPPTFRGIVRSSYHVPIK